MVHDVAIIGGGIVGLASAMAVAGAGRSVVVLEAEDRLAAHQTGHNSGVIHAGLYYRPGSLKARLCTEGREALYRFCEQHDLRHERCGKVVVAVDEQELGHLDELEQRGRANGLTGLRRLSAAELKEHEPHAAGVGGLHVAETGIVDFVAVARAMAEVVRRDGGEVYVQRRVVRARTEDGVVVILTDAGVVRCRTLVNCAGLQADRVARMCGARPGCRIVPFRGEYCCLVSGRTSLVRNLIYPVPDPRYPFLGVHLTRTIDGHVEAGPSAVLALNRHGYRRWRPRPADAVDTLGYPGFWRMAARHWRTGLIELQQSLSRRLFAQALQRLVPELRPTDLEPAGCGIRAQAVDPDGKLVDDFRIVEGDRMIHVLNAPSPAATASISIGRYIADLAVHGKRR